MLLEPNPELEIPPKLGKTLIISVAVHLILVAVLALAPDLFDSRLKRTIRIEGNDFDVRQLTELELQPVPKLAPAPAPKPEPSKPLVEPPPVQPPPPEAAAPPPPPPPPPPPVRAIAPDDILAPGARPDGQVQASRGNSSEQQRQGGAPADSTPQTGRGAAPPPPAPNSNAPATPPAVANTNPNAMTVPNLMQQANRNADQAARALQRSGAAGGTMGPKTGRSNAPNGQNFSADGGVQILSDTKGYDFGPYMNHVLNKVRNNWSIPDLARFGARGRVVVDFTIAKNGDIINCRIIGESGERSLDLAAKAAIDTSNPFQRLPSGFSGDELQLRFGFYYNIPVE